jgi:hypothetical protein
MLKKILKNYVLQMMVVTLGFTTIYSVCFADEAPVTFQCNIARGLNGVENIPSQKLEVPVTLRKNAKTQWVPVSSNNEKWVVSIEETEIEGESVFGLHLMRQTDGSSFFAVTGRASNIIHTLVLDKDFGILVSCRK